MSTLTAPIHDKIIERLQRGESVRKIARDMGLSKCTVSARRQMLLYQGQELAPSKGGHVGPAGARLLAWAKGIRFKRGNAKVVAPSHCSKCGRKF